MSRSQHTRCAIRSAATTEAGLLSALAMRSKAYWGYSSEFLEACRAELSYSPDQIESSKLMFTVAEVAGAVTGFYALEQLSPTEFELEALFVDPNHIGKGVGLALIEHAKSTAAKLGGKSLIIQGDPNAASFYQAAGGVHTGQRESGSIAGRLLPVFTVQLEAVHVA